MKTKKMSIGVIIVILFTIIGFGLVSLGEDYQRWEDGAPALVIPVLLDTKERQRISLRLQEGRHDFNNHLSGATMGFNQSYLGPVLRFYRNHPVYLDITNQLPDRVDLTIAGLGFTGQEREPALFKEVELAAGEVRKNISFTINQRASLGWYYASMPHQQGKYIHHGLSSLFIVEDDLSLGLVLPQTYGVDDIPLIIQDHSFSRGKMELYQENNGDEGFGGDTFVINGKIAPYVSVPRGWIRFRLLNASTGRSYNLRLQSKKVFYQIASDRGLLEQPVPIKILTMHPGERKEILIDLRSGNEDGLVGSFLTPDITAFSRKNILGQKKILRIFVNKYRKATGKLPYRLVNIEYYLQQNIQFVRSFELQRKEDSTKKITYTINNKVFDANRIDVRTSQGRLELWRLTSKDRAYPFQVSGTSFQLISQNGKHPAPENRGWKDVVLVSNEGWTEILIRFDHPTGASLPLRYFSSIIEHANHGMIGQIAVHPKD